MLEQDVCILSKQPMLTDKKTVSTLCLSLPYMSELLNFVPSTAPMKFLPNWLIKARVSVGTDADGSGWVTHPPTSPLYVRRERGTEMMRRAGNGKERRLPAYLLALAFAGVTKGCVRVTT